MITRNTFWMSLLCLAACNGNQGESGSESAEIPSYTIEQFYDNIAVAGGSFSENEEKILVSSNATGIYNVYEIDLATQEQTQLTESTEESYFAVDYVPGTDSFLYFADQGGNENDHLYLQAADGTVTDLTPGEQEKASFAGWTQAKDAFYYLSNVRDPRFFDLYRMEIGVWEPAMVYQNDQGYSFSGMSKDEKTIALTQSITRDHTKLFLYNLESETMQEISDPAKPAVYQAGLFTHDGQYFDYLTNDGEEFMYVVRYDLESGDRTVRFAPSWDVSYTYTSENGKYIVSGVNEDGKTVLHITDGEGSPVMLPDMGDASVASISIAESETQAILTVASSRSPSNKYLYNFETQALTQLTNTLNQEINPEHLVAAEVVRYPSFDGLDIPAIYYKPHQATADNKVPALVWVHGGPGGQSRVGFSQLIQYLVNHGYAVLAVNNRGSSGYGKTFFAGDDRNHGEKDLQDCIYAKKYLQELDYIDGEKIGIIGGSYGGYMTMAAMTFAPEEFEVGVNLFGVTNWIRTLRSIPPYWEAMRKALYQEMGDPNTEDSVRLYGNSPLFHAEKVTNPVMVLQGANDPRVLQVESDEIVEAVKANGVPVEYIVFPDEGHGFIKKENQIKGYRGILEFLNKYLKGEPEMI